jgi:hypothetical protein
MTFTLMAVSRLVLPATVVAVLGTAAVTSAQTPQMPPQAPAQDTPRSERPFRGTFGSGVDNRAQTLTFTGSLGAGYETEYLTAPTAGVNAGTSGGGGVAAGSGTLSYALNQTRGSVGASVTASSFYFDRSDASWVHTFSGSASQSLPLGRYTRLTANEYVARRPFRLDRLFPGAGEFSYGAPPALPGDQYSGVNQNLDFGVDVDLGHQVSQSVWMSGGYTLQTNQWDASSHQTRQGGRFGVGVSVGRGLSLRLGYGFYQSEYHDDEPRAVGQHNINAGVDYNGAISLSRRTSLSFSTGSTAIRDREETHFQITGRAQLSHELGRTWLAVAAYSRDAYYVDELSEVTLSDAVTFTVGGLLNRRVSFHSGVGVSTGNIGFSSGLNNTHAAYAVTGLTTALSRQTAVGIDYNYYLHFFGEDIVLPEGVLPEANRHSVRAYFTVWAPLMASGRSMNASR